MKVVLSSLLAGALFGLGLGVSGMTQADKVINFLDLSQGWDPSLALVMVGAIAVHLVLMRLILRRETPLLSDHFAVPTRTDLTPRLVGGSALFGVGWALGGYCPGPGLVSASGGSGQAMVFVAALIGGMLVFHVVDAAMKGAREQRAAERAGTEAMRAA